MARIRTVKPEFWSSEQIMECSRNARLLFIGMWNFCDDEGRMPFKPRQIKAQVFPGDDLSADEILGMLRELSGNGLIQIYTIEEQDYLQVTGWQHQRIDKRQPAKYPGMFHDNSKNNPGTVPPDRKGKERKKENNTKEFEDWYAAFPLHKGRGQAERAYRTARKTADAETLLAGAKQYANQRHGEDPQFTKHPATWLNGKCWLDETGAAVGNEAGAGAIDPDHETAREIWRLGKFLDTGTWHGTPGDEPTPDEARARLAVLQGKDPPEPPADSAPAPETQQAPEPTIDMPDIPADLDRRREAG